MICAMDYVAALAYGSSYSIREPFTTGRKKPKRHQDVGEAEEAERLDYYKVEAGYGYKVKSRASPEAIPKRYVLLRFPKTNLRSCVLSYIGSQLALQDVFYSLKVL